MPPRAALPAALGLAAAAALALVVGVLVATGGRIVYTIDDPYIHLALARQIAQGHYGLNAGEPSAPASSVLWPLLLAPLARTPLAVGWPLALALASVGASLVALDRLLRASLPAPEAVPGLRVLVLVLTLPAVHLLGVAFTGMEHALQIALTLAGVAGLATRAHGGRMPTWAVAALALGPLVRYENLALTMPAAVWLWTQGERRASLVAAGVPLVGLTAFSGLLVAMGLEPLPSSVLVKQTALGRSGLAGRLRTALTDSRGVLTVAGGVSLAAVALASRRTVPLRGLAAVGTATAALHALAGGWNYRYELYAVATVAAIGLALGAGALAAAWQRQAAATAAVAVVGVALLAAPYVYCTLIVPQAAGAVYRQQGQMARLVAEHVRAPVALNDLGYVAWRSPAYVLDLAGLASPEARRLWQASGGDPAWMEALARRHGADLAMLYPHWFGPARPASWVPLATLHLDRVSPFIAGQAVALHATRAEAVAPLTASLVAFARDLPDGARLVWAPGIGPAARPR